MGILYSEVERNKLMDEKVLKSIPSHCDCGKEIEFTASLKRIECSDKACKYKLNARMPEGKNWDGLRSPFQLLETGDIQEVNYVELWEVVAYAKIPELKGVECKIFKGYDSMEAAYRDIEHGQVPFIAHKIGIEESVGLVLALYVYRALIESKSELFYGEKWFKIRGAGERVYRIFLEGSVYGYRTKGQYVSFLNNRYRGRAMFLLDNEVTEGTDVFVYDGDDMERCLKALNINDNAKSTDESRLNPEGYPILIADSGGLVTVLDEKLGEPKK